MNRPQSFPYQSVDRHGSCGSGRTVPKRAVALSMVALAVPVVAALPAVTRPAGLEPLVWLVALVPVFLLSYHCGWRGAAAGSLAGVGVLAVTQVVVPALTSEPLPRWGSLVAVGSTYLLVCAAAGVLAESLHRSRDRAEALALTDELTGIPNRRHVRLVLEHDFAAAQRGRPLTVALFDLDRFKEYNDRHGHPAGDEALRRFATVLHAATRQMNTSGRYGGEEFLTVLSETDVEASLNFVERVRGVARDLDLPVGSITVSTGVASYHPGMETPDDLVAAADAAMYEAKSQGGDRVCVAEAPPNRSHSAHTRAGSAAGG